MPNRISTNDVSTFTPPANTAGNVPARFNSPETVRVWNGWPALGNGARGNGVKAVQQSLNQLGFSSGAPDGIMGNNTAGALKVFQRAKNLPETGKIDRGTLVALDRALQGNQVEPSRPDRPTPPPSSTLRNDRFKSDTQLSRVFAGQVTLSPGSRGDGVKAVQQALSDMGFAVPGGADGAYGGQSEKAVRNFQLHASGMFPEVRPTGVVDKATLQALDALAPKKGQQGQTTNIPNPRYDGRLVRVVVVKNEHRTYLFDKQGKLTDIFPNSVGARATQTESGLKVVTTKLDQRAAADTGRRLWGDGTVFGSRILDLSWADGSRSGEELHGTNAPNRLGEDVSHGCVRHGNADIVKMYDALSVGDRVAIVDRIDDPRLGPVQR